MKNRKVLFAILVTMFVLPITVIAALQQQDNRSKAASARVTVDVQPGGSINSAIQSAGSGGTVNVAAGTYNETLDISASNVTVQATGGRVITNGTMKISGQSVTLIGITVKGSSSFGAQVNGADGLVLKDFEIDGSQDGGLIISGSKNVVVDGCNIHGTNAEGTGADGEALSITGGSTGFEIKNCQVHDNGEEGIDAKYNGAGEVNGTIHDNVVFGNRGPNIYVDGSSGIKIYNNTSYGTTEGSKAGIMIAAETSYGGSENPKKAGNIDIFNNVIYGNAGGGITFWVESGGTLSDIRVYNNTIDEDKPINVVEAPSGSNPVFNNIFTSNPSGNGLQMGNNLVTTTGFVGNGDYHLAAGSPAIDKGDANGAPTFDKENKARPAGSGIDMGAYEFGATGGANPSISASPSLITPTIYCVGGVGEPPCAPINGTTTPGAGGGSPGSGTPGVTGGVNPSGGASTPYPSTVEPCQESTNSVMHNKKKHKKHKHGRGGGFIERFIKFLIWLIEYILRGGNVPLPTDPNNPCPEPTTEPQPTTEPTGGAEPTQDPTPTTFGTTAVPTISTAASPVPSTGGGTGDPTATTCGGSAATPNAPVTGYTISKCEDFNGTSMPSGWTAYDGGGGDTVVGGGRKSSQCTFGNGMLTQTQLADGSTCGMSSDFAQKYGYWEVRMRAYSTGTSGSAPHPVLILWPDTDVWNDGELDYFESNIGSGMGVFLHCVGNASQNCFSHEEDVDISQWHVYGFEWTAAGFKGYVDGQEIYSTDGQGSNPNVSMHQTIQLDNLTGQTPVKEGKMEVDWVHMYKK